MKKKFLLCLIVLLLGACEHNGHTVSEFSGDYRYYAGIAEFFDCNTRKRYYVANAGANSQLQDKYLELGVPVKEDVFVRVKGYLKKENQMDGIDPATVFVPVKLISLDANRGCTQSEMRGS